VTPRVLISKFVLAPRHTTARTVTTDTPEAAVLYELRDDASVPRLIAGASFGKFAGGPNGDLVGSLVSSRFAFEGLAFAA
jgi:hypothetical protein